MDLAKVQIKPLTGESDWLIWKYRIKFILQYHPGALEVVEGTLVKPRTLSAEASPAERQKHNEDAEKF